MTPRAEGSNQDKAFQVEGKASAKAITLQHVWHVQGTARETVCQEQNEQGQENEEAGQRENVGSDHRE